MVMRFEAFDGLWQEWIIRIVGGFKNAKSMPRFAGGGRSLVPMGQKCHRDGSKQRFSLSVGMYTNYDLTIHDF